MTVDEGKWQKIQEREVKKRRNLIFLKSLDCVLFVFVYQIIEQDINNTVIRILYFFLHCTYVMTIFIVL